eukprot:11067303-Alexandrium_andersonii.AAC.1
MGCRTLPLWRPPNSPSTWKNDAARGGRPLQLGLAGACLARDPASGAGARPARQLAAVQGSEEQTRRRSPWLPTPRGNAQ